MELITSIPNPSQRGQVSGLSPLRAVASDPTSLWFGDFNAVALAGGASTRKPTRNAEHDEVPGTKVSSAARTTTTKPNAHYRLHLISVDLGRPRAQTRPRRGSRASAGRKCVRHVEAWGVGSSGSGGWSTYVARAHVWSPLIRLPTTLCFYLPPTPRQRSYPAWACRANAPRGVRQRSSGGCLHVRVVPLNWLLLPPRRQRESACIK